MPAVVLALVLLLTQGQAAPPAPAAEPVLRQAVDQLGSLDFAVRTEAARRLRRAPKAAASGLLQQAVRTSKDEYVRFRALVLLTGMDEQAAAALASTVLSDRNDRLRTVAYQWFERHPNPSVLPQLVTALATEQSEFVRPALTRALAASSAEAQVQTVLGPLVMRGEDMFRGAVIEALGDYRGTFALADITKVAQLEGPLQDDAITALGRLAVPSSRATLIQLQQSALPELQPTVSAAVCLMGIDCDARVAYLSSTLTFSASNTGNQPLLRSAVHGLAALASAGHPQALDALIDVGSRSGESTRAPVALGVGLVAFRNATLVIDALGRRADGKAAASLLRDAFDMLSEDFEEERFATALRQAAGAPSSNATRRRTAEALLVELEY